jgi:hypothetical protein
MKRRKLGQMSDNDRACQVESEHRWQVSCDFPAGAHLIEAAQSEATPSGRGGGIARGKAISDYTFGGNSLFAEDTIPARRVQEIKVRGRDVHLFFRERFVRKRLRTESKAASPREVWTS